MEVHRACALVVRDGLARLRQALLLDELDLVIQAALDGAGMAWVAEDRITDHLPSGALVRDGRLVPAVSGLLSLLPQPATAARGTGRHASTRESP
jgi:DNA-binding transcriptional LysR family regulator